MKYLFLIVFCVTSLFVQTAFSCTLAGEAISAFDDSEYIFIGEIIGYTKAVESSELRSKAFGLMVKPKENIYLPKNPKSYFEVFPVSLWADCSLGGTQLEKLKLDFPLNSEVRVIAKEAKILPNNLPDNNIRLEELPGELGSVVLNYENEKRMTSNESVFDYKTFTHDIDEDSDSNYLLPNFEIRKDLLRLKNSRTQKEKTDILNRLLDLPVCCNDLDVYKLFKKYTSSENEFEFFKEARFKKTLTEEEFNQYKIIDEVEAELKKLKFSDDDVEKAVGKAIREKTEISKQKLFERSLKILKEQKN